jgi:hypothetical protein
MAPSALTNKRTVRTTNPPRATGRLEEWRHLPRICATTIRLRVAAASLHHVGFNASNLPSGIYFSSLAFGGKAPLKEMLLLECPPRGSFTARLSPESGFFCFGPALLSREKEGEYKHRPASVGRFSLQKSKCRSLDVASEITQEIMRARNNHTFFLGNRVVRSFFDFA